MKYLIALFTLILVGCTEKPSKEDATVIEASTAVSDVVDAADAEVGDSANDTFCQCTTDGDDCPEY